MSSRIGGLKINYIGCGRVGRTIGRLLVENKKATINGVLTKSRETASQSVEFIGQGLPYQSMTELIPADIHFIATPDDAIQKTCEQLAATGILEKGNLVVHFSGVHSSEVLKSARLKYCDVASIHPINSFANPMEAFKSFAGTYCALEGEGDKINFLAKLFEEIGGVAIKINKQHKSLYHAAGAMANNYLVTLFKLAMEAYIKAGIDEETAKNLTTSLMMGALANLKKFDPKGALTGPIQRGDQRTVEKHMIALQHEAALDVYSALGKATLSLTDHSDEMKRLLMETLSANKMEEGLWIV